MDQIAAKRYAVPKVNIEYYFLFIITFMLFAFGILIVFSSSTTYGERYFNDPYWFIRRQLIWSAISFIFFIIFSKFNYHNYSKLSNFIIVITIGLLALVLIPGFSIEVGGSKRWLNLLFFNVQPSEFTKIAVIIYLSEVLNRRYRNIYRIKNIIFPAFLTLFLITFLIFLEPDLGSVIVIWAVVFTILFAAEVKFKHIIGLGFMWLVITVGYLFMEEYRRVRIFAFINKAGEHSQANFQVTQSLIALGSGNITGLGLGNSIQKYFYLPEAHTDFIFAIIGEELGLIGTIFIVILFLLFTFFGVRVCLKAKDYFGRILAAGCTSLIAVQAMINIYVVIGLIPVTGLTLPFISLGGSSMLTSMVSTGILLNVSRYSAATLEKAEEDNKDNNQN